MGGAALGEWPVELFPPFWREDARSKSGNPKPSRSCGKRPCTSGNGSSEHGKSILSSNLGRGGSKMSIPEQFIVTALKDEASVLGIPAGILSARMAANLIEKLSMESDQTTLLSAEHRKKLFCLLQSLKELLTYNAFCHSVFAQEMWKMQRPPILEVAWHLHRENIVRLEGLLENSLCLLCHQMEEMDTEIGQNILTGKAGPKPGMWGPIYENQRGPLRTLFPDPGLSQSLDLALVLLQNGFPKTSESEKKLGMKKVSEICCAVLERMLAWVLDAVATEKQGRASPTGKAVRCWLQVYSLMVFQGTAPPETPQLLFGHIFTRVLTYNPHLTVSDAIYLQREWSFARTSSLLATLYRKVFAVFQPEELTRRLQQVLETSEVNWHHVLSCVSTLLACHCQAEQLVKGLLGGLLRKAFANYDLESLITTFLIVRQAALEGPALFPPYAEWFKLTFGSSSSLHGSSKKALIFLFKFLSQLVPFEAPQYLKVHLLHPPFVPSKYRTLLLEYITLAKTRLADLKVSIEDMGLYENLSSSKEASQACCQALQDVEKAVQIFRNTGKIPASVMEASIFRRSYYISRFLPALLVPRVLPETPDTRMTFIEALKRAEKIPPNAYATYLEECEAAKREPLREGSAEREAGSPKEPLERLKAELEALRLLVALVSGKLLEVLGHLTDDDEVASLTLRVRLDLAAPEVGAADQGAVDLLLASFCQDVMAASFFLPPDRQGPWPSLFVRMICGHRLLLTSLLSRLCQLLYHQGPSLSDAHILGLAAFVVHFTEAESLLPPVDLCFPSVPRVALHTDLPLAGLWDYLLAPRSGDSALFCLRFCTAAVSYFLCKFPSLSHEGLCSVLHPGFVKKLQYVVPRLCLEARETGHKGESAAFPWEVLSCPPLCHQKAALSLWKQARFQGLLREEAFQLTLPEWLKMELQHYLPRSVAAGGCGGNLREMGALFTNAILDFLQRTDSEACGLQRDCSLSPARGNPELYCRFQELVLELELERRRGLPGSCGTKEHFLFQVFRERLGALGTGAALGDRLLRQQELLSQTRILLSLPPSVLVATQKEGGETVVACEGFFSFVNTELRNSCSRGCALPYDITAHFFRVKETKEGWLSHPMGSGLLSTSLECSRPAQEVTAVLSSCQARCPLLLCSAVRWWPRLECVLCSQWKRLFGTPLAQGLQSLKDLQSSVQRKADVPRVLEWSSQVLQLGGRRAWLAGCLLSGRKRLRALQGPGAVSDQHLKMLPVAFYSLLSAFNVEELIRANPFLPVAVDMYAQLLQLFMEGATVVGPSWREQSLHICNLRGNSSSGQSPGATQGASPASKRCWTSRGTGPRAQGSPQQHRWGFARGRTPAFLKAAAPRRVSPTPPHPSQRWTNEGCALKLDLSSVHCAPPRGSFLWYLESRSPTDSPTDSLPSPPSCLASEATSRPSNTDWVPAAFLHFTVQQQAEREEKGEVLRRLGPEVQQVSSFSFHFQEEWESSGQMQKKERMSPEFWNGVPRCFSAWWKKGLAGWLSSVRQEKAASFTRPSVGAVSDQHLKMLPVAFYSLLSAFNVEELIREQTFLPVAVDMYAQLLQLFMEGATVVGPSWREQRDSLMLIQQAATPPQGNPRCHPGVSPASKRCWTSAGNWTQSSRQPSAAQFLVYVLFFSVMDFISAKEGTDVPRVLEWSSQVLQRLVEEGPGWLAVFCPAGKGCELYKALRGAVSDQHLKMLPVAFYSLLSAFNVEELIREQTFLPVAVDMYAQLLQLFMEGATVVGPSWREQRRFINADPASAATPPQGNPPVPPRELLQPPRDVGPLRGTGPRAQGSPQQHRWGFARGRTPAFLKAKQPPGEFLQPHPTPAKDGQMKDLGFGIEGKTSGFKSPSFSDLSQGICGCLVSDVHLHNRHRDALSSSSAGGAGRTCLLAKEGLLRRMPQPSLTRYFPGPLPKDPPKQTDTASCPARLRQSHVGVFSGGFLLRTPLYLDRLAFHSVQQRPGLWLHPLGFLLCLGQGVHHGHVDIEVVGLLEALPTLVTGKLQLRLCFVFGHV
ncbi:hypothetical protein E2320_001336, partial [Naja naja]